MMNRRRFVAHGLAAIPIPCVGYAQPPKTIPRIGYLLAVPLVEKPSPERIAFIDGLRQLGYRDRQTIIIEYRSAAGNFDLLSDLVAELVDLKVNVIAATGFQATLAAKNTTKTVPIVMIAVGDPVGTGLVSSLARPGGNVTGLTLSFPELGGKRVELLKEVVPRLGQVAVVWNPQNAATTAEWKEMHVAARTLGVSLKSFEVGQAQDLLNAFSAISKHRPSGLITILDTLVGPYRQLIATFALENRLPSILSLRDYAESGGLMSYGPSLPEIYRRAASYVDKILQGAKPADLPIEQPTKFELVINLKTAKVLGLTIPPSILVRADEIIQ
jgi:putative tryptophan/tyrosine transport system substrate-binding protein